MSFSTSVNASRRMAPNEKPHCLAILRDGRARARPPQDEAEMNHTLRCLARDLATR